MRKSAVCVIFGLAVVAGLAACKEETVAKDTQAAETALVAALKSDGDRLPDVAANPAGMTNRRLGVGAVVVSSMPDSFVVPKNTCENGHALRSYSAADNKASKDNQSAVIGTAIGSAIGSGIVLQSTFKAASRETADPFGLEQAPRGNGNLTQISR